MALRSFAYPSGAILTSRTVPPSKEHQHDAIAHAPRDRAPPQQRRSYGAFMCVVYKYCHAVAETHGCRTSNSCWQPDAHNYNLPRDAQLLSLAGVYLAATAFWCATAHDPITDTVAVPCSHVSHVADVCQGERSPGAVRRYPTSALLQ